MSQKSLTDDRFLTSTNTSTEPSSENTPPSRFDHDASALDESHPALDDVDVNVLTLATTAEGWQSFPLPDDIQTHVDEDISADTTSLPQEVRDAIDRLTDEPCVGEFLVFDAAAAYEYLETLQKTSDLHLENFHRRQLVVNQLSNGRGMAKGSSLSTYDKKWICQWEVQRRLAERPFDTWNETKIRAHS